MANRRDFIKISALGLGGIGLGNLAWAAFENTTGRDETKGNVPDGYIKTKKEKSGKLKVMTKTSIATEGSVHVELVA